MENAAIDESFSLAPARSCHSVFQRFAFPRIARRSVLLQGFGSLMSAPRPRKKAITSRLHTRVASFRRENPARRELDVGSVPQTRAITGFRATPCPAACIENRSVTSSALSREVDRFDVFLKQTGERSNASFCSPVLLLVKRSRNVHHPAKTRAVRNLERMTFRPQKAGCSSYRTTYSSSRTFFRSSDHP
jgi:hypothetical protein